MCDIGTAIGVALSAASAGANAAAASRVQNARDDAMAAERIRQQGLDKEAASLNKNTQNSYKNIEDQQGEKAASLADYFTGQEVGPAPASEAVPQSSSNITVQEQGKQQAKAKAMTNETGTALGNLRSFGDLMGDLGRGQARSATEIGQIGGFKRGSSNVLGYELDDASHAGDGMKLFGDILGGAGSLATGFGLSGTPAAAAAAPNASIGSMAAARAADRVSVPFYSATPKRSIFGIFGGA